MSTLSNEIAETYHVGTTFLVATLCGLLRFPSVVPRVTSNASWAWVVQMHNGGIKLRKIHHL